ncbi:hypothetical protein MRX96_039971 [Rhipicephalus microplus]
MGPSIPAGTVQVVASPSGTVKVIGMATATSGPTAGASAPGAVSSPGVGGSPLVALAMAASTAAGSVAQPTAGKSLVRVTTSAAPSGIGRQTPTTGPSPVTLVTAAKSLFLGGPQGGVAATMAAVGSNPPARCGGGWATYGHCGDNTHRPTRPAANPNTSRDWCNGAV